MGINTDNRKFLTVRIEFTENFPFITDPGTTEEKQYPSLFEIVHTEDIVPVTNMFRSAGGNGEDYIETHCRFLTESGEFHWFFLSCNAVLSQYGKTQYLEGTMCDVSQYLETVDEDLVYKKFRLKHEELLAKIRQKSLKLEEVVSVEYLRSIQEPFAKERIYSAIFEQGGKLICTPEGQKEIFDEDSFQYKLKAEIRINHLTAAYWVLAGDSEEDVARHENLWTTLVQTVSQMANAFVALVNEMENSQDANKLLGQNIEEQILLNNIYSIIMQSKNSEQALESVLALTGDYMKIEKIVLANADETRKVRCLWHKEGLAQQHCNNVRQYGDEEFQSIFSAIEFNSSVFADTEDNLLSQHGVKSFGIYKLFDNGSFSSVIIYEMFTRERQWTQRERTQLKNISQIIASVMMRMKTESRLEESQSKLRQLAFYDSIYGVPNRAKLMKDLSAKLEKGEKGAVIAFKMTNTRNISAVYGHTYSDMLLRSIAQHLLMMPIANVSTYYFSNAVFMLEFANADNAMTKQLCEMLIGRFSRPWIFEGTEHLINCSMGIAFYPSNGRTAEEVARAANVAMYRAREFRNNSYAFYKGIAEKNIEKSSNTERCVLNAVRSGMRGFSLSYQPVYNATDGSICYCESLLRFNTQEFGHVPNSILFPIAENLGLSHTIDRWALNQSCNFCKKIQDSGQKDFKISVNLSIGELETGSAVEAVKYALEQSGLSASSLILEIPVKSNYSYTDSTQVLSDLKMLGVNIAIDSYGTEDVSLKVLKSSYLDYINVPRVLLTSAEDSFDKELVTAIINLSHCRMVKICIKGIEDRSQLEKAVNSGTDYVQGYFCSRPVSDRELMMAMDRKVTISV